MIRTFDLEVGGRLMSFETGRLAAQAGGAVTLRYGDLMLLATATADKNPRQGVDFLPLTVDVAEKAYAAGKMPGGFFKREGRPSSEAILAARLCDRPLRPLFPKNFHYETQLIVTILAADEVNPYAPLGNRWRISRTGNLGHSVRRPGRCLQHRIHRRRPYRQPDV